MFEFNSFTSSFMGGKEENNSMGELNQNIINKLLLDYFFTDFNKDKFPFLEKFLGKEISLQFAFDNNYSKLVDYLINTYGVSYVNLHNAYINNVDIQIVKKYQEYVLGDGNLYPDATNFTMDLEKMTNISNTMNLVAKNGNVETLRFLLERTKGKPTVYAIDLAYENGHNDMVLFLKKECKLTVSQGGNMYNNDGEMRQLSALETLNMLQNNGDS